MSYASFTKIVPDLLKSAPQKLFQPTGIAVIASVGIHALVGVSLPYWSSSAKKSPPVRNVKLLQLTPAEQSRLPQVPPSSLPSVANQLPPLSSLPSTGSSLGSSSLPPLPSKDSSLFNLPPITPLPPLGKIPSLSSQLPRQQINLNKLAIRNSPPRKDLSTSKPSTSSSPLSKVPSNQQITPLNGEMPPPPLTPWPAPSKELLDLPRGLYPAYPPAVALNPDGTVPQQPMLPPTMPERPLPPVTQAPLPIDRYPIPPSGGNLTQTPQTTAFGPSQSQRDVTDNSNSSSSIDRNNIAFLNNLQDWRKRNQIDELKGLVIPGNYPEKVSSTGGPINGKVAVAVKVDKDGKIIPNTLELMGNFSDQEAFEKAAISAIQKYSFRPTGQTVGYVITVPFQNDSSDLKSPTPLQPPVAAPNSAGLLNLPKLSSPTNATPSTITGTPAQNLMEKLRRNLTNTPPSSTTDKKPESTTNTSRSNTTDKKPEGTTNTSRSNTIDKKPENTNNTPPSSTTDKKPEGTTNTSPSSTADKKPESTTNTSRSNTTDKKPESTTNTSRCNRIDKKPENTTNTSRSNTTDKKPESTTNTSRSNTTDTSAQNLINKLRRSLNDTPPSKTTDTPRSNTTDTTPANPTKE